MLEERFPCGPVVVVRGCRVADVLRVGVVLFVAGVVLCVDGASFCVESFLFWALCIALRAFCVDPALLKVSLAFSTELASEPSACWRSNSSIKRRL